MYFAWMPYQNVLPYFHPWAYFYFRKLQASQVGKGLQACELKQSTAIFKKKLMILGSSAAKSCFLMKYFEWLNVFLYFSFRGLQLLLNARKTKCMLSNQSLPAPAHPSSVTTLDGSDLEYVNNNKYLGVSLDRKLLPDSHKTSPIQN